jgi:hypothetical protein
VQVELIVLWHDDPVGLRACALGDHESARRRGETAYIINPTGARNIGTLVCQECGELIIAAHRSLAFLEEPRRSEVAVAARKAAEAAMELGLRGAAIRAWLEVVGDG